MSLVMRKPFTRWGYRKKVVNPKKVVKLPLSMLHVSERCGRGCNYCAIDAKSTDAQMPWPLFMGILKSKQVIFFRNPGLFLGDGEVIIYRDAKEGKNLLDILEMLLCRMKLHVQFTTAGLVPVNIQEGRDVLMGLRDLGHYLSRLTVNLSFNFLHGLSHSEYMQCMGETLSAMLDSRFAPTVSMNMMQDPSTRPGSTEYEHLVCSAAELHEKYGVGGGDVLTVGPFGRALRYYRFEADSRPEEERAADICLCPVYKSRDAPLFGVRANGDILPACLAMGERGATIGNVLTNDASQIHSLLEEFLLEHILRTANRPDTLQMCEHHMRWNKHFSSERSENPIIVLP